MKTIPLDTRTRLLAHYDTGKVTRAEAAEHFAVSVDFVKKLLKQRKKLGHLKPLYNRAGRNTKMTQERKDTLLEALRQTPGLTLKQMRELLGGVCTGVCIHLTLKKVGVTYKKKRCELPGKIVRTYGKSAGNGACARPRSNRKALCLLTNRAPRRT
jgi:transposase